MLVNLGLKEAFLQAFTGFDAASRLIERTDRLGRVIEFEYDAHDNLVEERWYVGVNLVHSILFDYDEAGQLLEAYDTASSYGYTYDGLGRVTSLSQSFAGFSPLLEYESTYDANSNRTLLQAIIGGTADFENEYTYDDLDRLTRLAQSDYASGNAVAEKRFDFFYSANSQLSRFDRYADLAGTEYVASTHYAYDAIGRLARLTHNDSTSSTSGFGTNPLAGYQFTYDAASRITDIDSYLDGLSEYTYDATNQLIDADHAGQSDEAYEFDENGNRVMSGYSIDPNNQLASDGAYNYTYDAEGNRLTKTNVSTGAKEELTWDHRNRLTKVTFKNSGGTVLKTVDYVYDALDRMIRRTYDADGPGGAAATDRFFSWENDQINLEFDGTTASDLAHRHTWAEQIDHLLATEDISSLVTPGDVIWALNDHLGTARDLVEYDTGTNTPTVENHREYNSFGILVSQTNGAFSITFGFTGVFHDVVTTLNYHRARWYDPATGNWTAEDPIGFSGDASNTYRYVTNKPLSGSDPTGLDGPFGPFTPMDKERMGRREVVLSISFETDKKTTVAGLWNQFWSDEAVWFCGNGEIDWKRKTRDLQAMIDRGVKIDMIIISSHGGDGIGGIPKEALDPSHPAHAFLVKLEELLVDGGTIEARVCACGTKQKLMSRFAIFMKAKVVGYTDSYAIWPYGDEVHYNPDGSIVVVRNHPGTPINRKIDF